MKEESWILFLCFWILICMSITEIKDIKVRAEIKEALELVKKANAKMESYSNCEDK